MKKLKCKDCGNTNYFNRSCSAYVSFSTIKEMEESEMEFLDWTDEITCDECSGENVEEVEEKENE